MAVRARNALQPAGFYNYSDPIHSTAFEDVPGLVLSVPAESHFFVDCRFIAIQGGGTSGLKFHADGFDEVTGVDPSYLVWRMYNDPTQTGLSSLAEPDSHFWTLPLFQTYSGEVHLFGSLRNIQTTPVDFKIQFAPVTTAGNAPQIFGGRLTIFTITEDQPINFSNMNTCGCCLSATISCCQEAITINTANPSSSIQWKLTDGLGAVYTGTMTTDGAGVGTITIGDDMDLPEGFIDVPGVGFRLEFLDSIPSIAMKVACIDVETVGGAYLAIQSIGETLS